MLTTAVLLYFLTVVTLLALVFLPAARSRTVAVCGRLGRGALAAVGGLVAPARRGRGRAATTARAGAAWAADHAAWLAAAGATLALPPLLAWLLQGWQDVDGYDHTVSRPVNEHVAALLRGEQLAPPAPLPPALFATPEVEAAAPLIRDASRQWELLDDDFRQRLLVVFRLMQERHGYEMVLIEGYRSPERQARLAALGGRVTGAAAWQSYHQYGLAADSAFRRDGKVVIAETDPWAMRGYALFGSIAQSAGLVWGGGWRLRDFGHVELRRPGTLGREAAGRAMRVGDVRSGLKSSDNFLYLRWPIDIPPDSSSPSRWPPSRFSPRAAAATMFVRPPTTRRARRSPPTAPPSSSARTFPATRRCRKRRRATGPA